MSMGLKNASINLKIRTKLILFLCVPIITILFFTLSGTYFKYQELKAATESQEFITVSLQLTELVFELQRERGLTAGFIGSKGEHFKGQLLYQRQQTDKHLLEFKRLIQVNDPGKRYWGISSEFKQVLSGLKSLEDKRNKTDALANGGFFDYYSNLIAECLRVVQYIQVFTDDVRLARQASAYIILTWLQERSGQERGALNNLFELKTQDIKKYMAVSSYVAEQKTLFINYYTVAEEKYKKLLREKMQDPNVDVVLKLRSLAFENVKRIDLLRSIQVLVGYGGLIHDFKNYVLRGDNKYLDRFSTNLKKALDLISEYQSFQGVNQQDIKYIKDIEITFKKYNSSLKTVTDMKKSNYSANEIDQVVKVDDTIALNAIRNLHSRLLNIDTSNWWGQATYRIDLMKSVSDVIKVDIDNRANLLIINSKQSLLFYVSLSIMSILMTMLLGYFLIKRLVYEIEHISTSMINMQKAGDYNCLLNVKGKDEIGEMAEAFNNMVVERKFYESKLKLASAVFENSSEGIMVTDALNKIETVNAAYTRITGYGEEESVGKSPSFMNSGKQDENFYKKMWRRLLRDNNWEGEIWNRRKDGTVYPELLSVNVVRNKDHEISHYIGMFRDITERKAYEENIWRQANYDPLTGLANRKMFMEHLGYEMERAIRSGNEVALLFVDLDRFKLINDTMGHSAGDELLQQVSLRLQECVRKSDTVARLGGDEFIIVITDIHEGFSIDPIIKKLLDGMARVFYLNGEKEALVSGSIGIAMFPDDGETIETLLKNADKAMYCAKESGKNTFTYFKERKTND